MKKRMSFTPIQKKCLEEHYNRGMTSTRDKQKIAEVAQQLGVTVTQVEVYLSDIS